MNRVTSFDVFDTLLTRTVAVPRDLFVTLGVALQKLGVCKIDPAELAIKRIRAEQSAARAERSGQPSLESIYAELGREFNWTDADAARARDLELDLEAQSLTPVPGALEVVNRARGEGRQVVFISDTYLPTAFIEAQLLRHGFFRTNDLLFASGHEKASKVAGDLFDVARSKLGNPTDWLHIGDDPNADGTMPKKRRIRISPRPHARLTRYEATVRGGLDRLVAPLWQSRVAGASRLARLGANSLESRADAIARVSTGVAAPLLISFVIWVLEQAERQGLKRLYFLARDGQILLKIARALQQEGHYASIDCRYLAASRQAWHPAAILDFDKEDLEKLHVAGANISLRNVLKLTALEPEQCAERLDKLGFHPAEWDLPMSARRRQEWESVLAAGHFTDLIRAAAAEKRTLLLEYLRQEKFFDLPACGVVDIGWYGRLQSSLDKILSQLPPAERPRVTGIYFGLKPHAGAPDHLVRQGFWNEYMPGREVTPLEMALLERFTAADHGSVIGFHHDVGNKIEPTLAEAHNTRALQWGLAAMQQSIQAVVVRVAAMEAFADINAGVLLQQAVKALDQLIQSPLPDEAAAWGSFPMSSQQFESTYEVLVPKWTWSTAIAAIFDRSARPNVWWKQAAKLQATIAPVKVYLRAMARPSG